MIMRMLRKMPKMAAPIPPFAIFFAHFRDFLSATSSLFGRKGMIGCNRLISNTAEPVYSYISYGN